MALFPPPPPPTPSFLFEGNGKAVPVAIQSVPALYDTPRASFDSGLPASYFKREGSIPETSNPYQHIAKKIMEPDSGYLTSPVNFGLEGPPVRLDKHPSFQKQRSALCGRRQHNRSNCNSTSSSLNKRDASNPSLPTAESFSEDILFDRGDSPTTPTRSPSPPEHPDGAEDCFMGSMDQDDIFADSYPPKRSYTEPAGGSEKHKMPSRCHSTATCQAATRRVHEYEVMVHPKHAAMYGREGYTYMNPAEMKAQPSITHSAPIPVSRPNAEAVAGQLFPNLWSTSSASPRRYQHYDRLPTIAEREARQKRQEAEEAHKDRSSSYENFPLPPDVTNSSPVYYTPNYENVSMAHSNGRESQIRDEYKNVTQTGEQIAGSPSGGSRLQKKPSLRKSFTDKRLPLKENTLSINGKEIKSPSPPQKNGLRYIQVDHSAGGSDHTNRTVKEVKYASVDFPSTEDFPNLRRQE